MVGVGEAAVSVRKVYGAVGRGSGFGHMRIDVGVRIEIGVGFLKLFGLFDFGIYELRVILMNVGEDACRIVDERIGKLRVNFLADRQAELNHIIE